MPFTGRTGEAPHPLTCLEGGDDFSDILPKSTYIHCHAMSHDLTSDKVSVKDTCSRPHTLLTIEFCINDIFNPIQSNASLFQA